MSLSPIVSGALLIMTTNFGPAQSVPVDSGRWQFHAKTSRVEEHLGRPSLYLEKGIATLADVRMTDGWIAFDVAFSDGRGFMGGLWRVEDPENYEEFYLRSHQSGNPDASQYTPVFHGIEGWQLYHGARYSVPLVHRFDEWTRVKIVFVGERAEIYVRDMEKPSLVVERLKRDVQAGGIGVNAGLFAPAYFSSFTFATAESPGRVAATSAEDSAPGVISSWQVSDTFAASALADKVTLAPSDLEGRRWTSLATEGSGLADLARVQGFEPPNDTVFARAMIVSGKDQIKRLDFGFCDRVQVYLNGRLLFRGDDTPRSRDYRFLGSIGYFDSLYLTLRKGENELVLAVTEKVGSWGVQAKVADSADITFQN